MTHPTEKIEYHLKTKSGTLVATFDTIEGANKLIDLRKRNHGDKVAPLELYKVTTITEKL